MVPFTSRLTSTAIAFALVVDAMSVNPLVGPGSALILPSFGDENRMVKVRVPSDEGGSGIRMFTQRSDHLSAIMYTASPFLRSRSDVGPLRLNSDGLGRRGHHGKHGKHGRHGRKKQHRDQDVHSKLTNTTTPEPFVHPFTPSASISRRSVYMTNGYGNHRISIKPVAHHLPRADRDDSLAARGLLDPIVPIIGVISGLEGVVKLVPELLNGLLGPVLGGLIISPNKPQGQALASSNEGHTLESESQYILAATRGNMSTIWLVDTGRSAPPDTEPALTSYSNSTAATTNERMVSLQMAFVDAKTGDLEAYCATYERDPAKPVSLGVVPCKDPNPKESQMFAYNPESHVLRAIWNSIEIDAAPLGRRKYMVGGGMNVTAEGAESMVVMVFEPVNASSTTPGEGVQTFKAAPSLEDSNASSSTAQASAEDDGENDWKERGPEDDYDNYEESESATTASVTPNSPTETVVGVLDDPTAATTTIVSSATESPLAVGAPSETGLSTSAASSANATPVVVQHVNKSSSK